MTNSYIDKKITDQLDDVVMKYYIEVVECTKEQNKKLQKSFDELQIEKDALKIELKNVKESLAEKERIIQEISKHWYWS